MDRTAKTFLEYALAECERERRTEDAIDFDVRLLVIARFYNQEFYRKGENILNIFENFKTNLKIGVLRIGNEEIPKTTVDDIIRQYQKHGYKLIWKEEIFNKVFQPL